MELIITFKLHSVKTSEYYMTTLLTRIQYYHGSEAHSTNIIISYITSYIYTLHQWSLFIVVPTVVIEIFVTTVLA